MLGWPIRLPGSPYCGLLLPVDDGTIRVVCEPGDQATDAPRVLAFAFDARGNPLAGWPVDLPCCFTGRVLGDELTVYAREHFLTGFEEGQPAGNAWIVTVAADGTVRHGAKVPFVNVCCGDSWAVGPDGVAYGSNHQFGDSPSAPKSSELLAVNFAGVPAGFPIAIDGLASEPAFDQAGRIHVTVATEVGGPARTLVFDTDGQAVDGLSAELGIAASADCAGIEGSCEVPAAPLVGPDGTTYVIGWDFNGAISVGVRYGQVMAGWPYRSDAGRQGTGFCPEGAACDAFNLAAPTIGPENDVLYLPSAARDASVGGSIVAVGPDGRVRPGWPVELRRPGAEFWSVVVGSDGTVYALAIELESSNTSSATILAIAPDSTVLFRTTIVDP